MWASAPVLHISPRLSVAGFSEVETVTDGRFRTWKRIIPASPDVHVPEIHIGETWGGQPWVWMDSGPSQWSGRKTSRPGHHDNQSHTQKVNYGTLSVASSENTEGGDIWHTCSIISSPKVMLSLMDKSLPRPPKSYSECNRRDVKPQDCWLSSGTWKENKKQEGKVWGQRSRDANTMMKTLAARFCSNLVVSGPWRCVKSLGNKVVQIFLPSGGGGAEPPPVILIISVFSSCSKTLFLLV